MQIKILNRKIWLYKYNFDLLCFKNLFSFFTLLFLFSFDFAFGIFKRIWQQFDSSSSTIKSISDSEIFFIYYIIFNPILNSLFGNLFWVICNIFIRLITQISLIWLLIGKACSKAKTGLKSSFFNFVNDFLLLWVSNVKRSSKNLSWLHSCCWLRVMFICFEFSLIKVLTWLLSEPALRILPLTLCWVNFILFTMLSYISILFF